MATTDVPEETPLEGKTTVDDKMTFEPERLSYKCADRLAKKIADAVKADVENQIVVITGTGFFTDLANLQAILVKLEELKRGYVSLAQYADKMQERRSIAEGAPQQRYQALGIVSGLATGVAVGAPGFGAVAVGLNTVLGLVSLFREDVGYSGIQTVINPLAFELALAAKIKAGGATSVFVPDLTLPPLDQSDGSISFLLNKVQEAKINVWEIVGPSISKLVRLDAELDSSTKKKQQELVDQLSRELAGLRQDLDPVTEQLKQADQQLADLHAVLDKTDEKTGLTMLARLQRAEGIRAMNPRYLHALVVASGGFNRTSRSLLRTIFSGDGLSFLGGATARWALLKENGSVAKGGIESEQEWGTFSQV